MVVLLAVAPLALTAGALGAQESAPPPKKKSKWKRTVELAGSLFIGNKPQTVLTTRGTTSHRDSTFELSADMRFTYGESNRDGVREVSQRHWFGSASVDVLPYAGHSPFLLGTVESSFERRIDLRISGGLGHKMTFVSTDRALANLSVAMLGEHSRLPGTDGVPVTEELARLSLRLRLRRKMSERAEISHETFYRPEYTAMTSFTFSNSVTAGYRMNDAVALKVSYLDNYDSEARGRGALSNYDGQLVVGVQAAF
ncbi:MAG TPA: DUF481 domain-containing protein [Gemmatimonadaceae bacterium]|nr:DUF481 domain-containing protein [Gemmatimonadaceae bacterium]